MPGRLSSPHDFVDCVRRDRFGQRAIPIADSPEEGACRIQPASITLKLIDDQAACSGMQWHVAIAKRNYFLTSSAGHVVHLCFGPETPLPIFLATALFSSLNTAPMLVVICSEVPRLVSRLSTRSASSVGLIRSVSSFFSDGAPRSVAPDALWAFRWTGDLTSRDEERDASFVRARTSCACTAEATNKASARGAMPPACWA